MKRLYWPAVAPAALLVSAVLVSGACAAAPSGPATIWKFLGIRQGSRTARDATANRNGNNPQRERKPPLKRIADPENLDPESLAGKNPAINGAANVKAQEDLAKQKVKAVKYLAKIGCGCYPEVKPALLAALDDCTEEVRYEAAKAFCHASGDPCATCNKGSCCDAAVMSKLAKIAREKDAQGCYKEPSRRVREAAELALRACERVTPPKVAEPVPPKETPRETGASGPGESRTEDRGLKPVPSVPDRGPPKAKPKQEKPTASVKPIGFSLSSDVQQSAYSAAEGQAPPAGEMSVEGKDLPNGVEFSRDRELGARVEPADQLLYPHDRLLYPHDGVIRPEGGRMRLASFLEFQPPMQPIQPLPMPAPTEVAGITSSLSFNVNKEILTGVLGETRPSGSESARPKDEPVTPPDLGAALSHSPDVQTTKARRRSQAVLEPYVRGYRGAQIYTEANGVYWMPARWDMDSAISKLDPDLVQDVVIVPGPYGLRYGPGFAFIDVVRAPTPRYQNGFESHFETSGSVRTNGGQFYGRETVYGGNCNWGFRGSYGHRKGSDYNAGNGIDIPASYENRDVWSEIGFDINPHQRIEFAYQRFGQTDTQYPGQFFDVGFLGANGFEARIVDDDPLSPWEKLTAEGWYNRTTFRGDTLTKLTDGFNDLIRVDYALSQELGGPSAVEGTTHGGLDSGGFRTAATFGDLQATYLNVGVDYRYLSQVMREDFFLDTRHTPFPALTGQFFTNMPHAWYSDPGIYGELSSPVTEWWRLSLGARLDFTSSRARFSDLRVRGEPGNEAGSNSSLACCGQPPLEQSDTLVAFYVNNQLDMTDNWSITAGFGRAQRAPTLFERYADGLFLSYAQSGFTRMIGDPRLVPETDWQVDLGTNLQLERFRLRASVFHAWIEDYITVADDTVVNFADARLLRYINTGLGTLVGFETYGEYDLNSRLTAFASLSYVEGRDQTIHEPLPGISPLDSTVGLRLHDAARRKWGIELGTRIVDNQNRLGYVRLQGGVRAIEQPTPGFAVWHLRGYYNYSENFNIVAGIDNLFDRTYQDHLDLRLSGPTQPNGDSVFGTSRVLEPGFTPYVGINWIF